MVRVHRVGEMNQQLDGEKSTAEIDLVITCTCGVWCDYTCYRGRRNISPYQCCDVTHSPTRHGRSPFAA
jgi:hypothetical protein